MRNPEMPQCIFIGGLYLLGYLFGLLFVKRIQYSFIVISGFLWGSIFWVLQSIVIFTAGSKISPVSTALFFLVAAVTLVALNIKAQVFQMPFIMYLYPMVALLVLFGSTIIVSQINLSWASPDSVYQIMTGRWIALDGFYKWNVGEFTMWGVFLPMMHAASIVTTGEYLFSLSLTYSLTLLGLLISMIYQELNPICSIGGFGWSFPLIMLVIFTTAPMITDHVFYVHNNLPSGVYLFVAVTSAWYTITKRNSYYIIFASLAFLGFGLLRLEAPLFVVMFIAIVLSTGKLIYRERVLLVVPVLALLLLWYVEMLIIVDKKYWSTILRNPVMAFAIILILLLVCIYTLLSKLSWVERTIQPRLHIFLALATGIFLVTAYILYTGKMVESLLNTLENMTRVEDWGLVWIVFFSLIPLLLIKTDISGERLFSVGTGMFLLCIQALVVARSAYNPTYGDSGNRMLLHIAPIILFYYLLKYKSLVIKRLDSQQVLMSTS